MYNSLPEKRIITNRESFRTQLSPYLIINYILRLVIPEIPTKMLYELERLVPPTPNLWGKCIVSIINIHI